MRGLPKIIRTRNDIEVLMAYLGTPAATPDRVAWGLRQLRGLLASRQRYEFDRVLTEGEDPDGPEPEYRVLPGQGEAQDERHQFQLADDPTGRIYRLGLTDAEVRDWIEQLEAL